MKKRIISLLVSFCLILTCVPAPVSALASTGSDEKPADTQQTKVSLPQPIYLNTYSAGSYFTSAESIDLDTTYYDKLTSYEDENYYKFTLSNPGYITLDLGKEYLEQTYKQWNVYLYDSTYTKIKSWYFQTGDLRTETTCKIGLPVGTYYIKFDTTDSYDYTSALYNFKINYTKSSVWERELNDTLQKANSIKMGTKYYGTIMNYEDEDYYKFILSSPGYINLDFGKEFLEATHKEWIARLYDSTYTEIKDWYFYTGDLRTETTCKVGLPAGTYYIKIETPDSYDWTDIKYNFKVNYAQSSVWESELNGSVQNADTATMGKGYCGAIMDYDDVDYYKIKKTSGSNCFFYFGKEFEEDEDAGWEVTLYDSEMVAIKNYVIFGGNDKTFRSELFYLKAGTYYVKVDRLGNLTSARYYIKLSPHSHQYTQKVTKATLTKNGKIDSKCSCGNLSSSKAIYYPKTIKLSTTAYTYNGKVKKPAVTVKDSKGKTISSSNYTVTYPSGRKLVGTYKVTIKFKGNYSGTATRSFTIKPKGTGISSLSSRSRGFKIYIKKQATQTTGYQVQYSRYSSFKNATTSTITKNTKTSATYTKLSPKKKYYVRVRTYKIVNGTKYYSAWSSSRAVTTKS